MVEDALAHEGAVAVRVGTPSMANGSSDATLSNASTITISSGTRMATHSVRPLAISVTVRVWTKSPSVFTPPQCSTMSISRKPAGGSRQLAKVRTEMLRRDAALTCKTLRSMAQARSGLPCRSMASTRTGINAFKRLPQTLSAALHRTVSA